MYKYCTLFRFPRFRIVILSPAEKPFNNTKNITSDEVATGRNDLLSENG